MKTITIELVDGHPDLPLEEHDVPFGQVAAGNVICYTAGLTEEQWRVILPRPEDCEIGQFIMNVTRRIQIYPYHEDVEVNDHKLMVLTIVGNLVQVDTFVRQGLQDLRTGSAEEIKVDPPARKTRSWSI